MNTNFNNTLNTEENMDNLIIYSYMNFVDTTNTSIHSMIEIINNQQRSFNQILNRYTPPPTSYTTRIRRDISNRYLFPTNQHITHTPNPLRRSFNRRSSTRYYTLPVVTSIFDSMVNTRPNGSPIQRPTSEQIVNATEMIPFSDISNPLNISCPISQIDFSNNDTVIIIKQCRHIFSQNSILRWFERNVDCPLCRYDIRTYNTEESDINGEEPNEEPNEEPTSDPTDLDETESAQINSPYSTPLPFAQQLANMISDQLTSDRDFSGNINIELAIPPVE